MKLLFENWRKHLGEPPEEEGLEKLEKVRELLCQVVEELFGKEQLPGGKITIETGGNELEFVIAKGRDVTGACVFPYTSGTELDKFIARGGAGDVGLDEPTGMPVEEEKKK